MRAFACGAMLAVAVVALGADEDGCVMRQGLPNACRIWREKKQEGTVFYIGGGAGNAKGGTRETFTGVVKATFPEVRGLRLFSAWNRIYPDRCSSVIEVFRAMSSPAASSGEAGYPFVALTVVELSAEDIGMPEAEVLAALEGMVRYLRRKVPSRDILFIHPADPRFVADYRAGRVPDAIRWHESVAEHYGIPSVNLARIAALKTEGAGIDAKGLLHASAGALLAQCAAQPAQPKPVRYASPKPLSPSPWDNPVLVNYERGELDPAGWLGWQLSPVDQIFHVAACSTPGPEMRMDFIGTAVGVYGVTGPDAGDLEFSLDGGRWQGVSVFDREAEDGTCHLFLQMEPLGYNPPKDRWGLIPKTMKRLREGGKLRVVMLGDSIVNNIQSSSFNLLVERTYPGSSIEKIVSVRGSTGCWYYQEPENLKRYVLRHAPDLLVIGGISQRGDVEAIRSVISQTRAALPEVEVIVLTDVFGAKGTIDPYDPKTAAEPDPNGTGYRERLLKMANEEKVEYLNLTQPWARFLAASKQPLGAFMSDAVHANARGCQLIGRFLELYFAPDGWDARGVAQAALKRPASAGP
ncbi:MAG: SGNH/GDSL hydrolase family protein [Lentisphaerae bacterium]|nr:SGNH/GDSL hydrolase family protein [Lentisphaerota bacterium]